MNNGRKTIVKMLASLFVLLILAASGGLAQAAWADMFPSPEAVGPGTVETPGPVLNTLTPELKFVTVGSLSYIYLFDAQNPRMTLGEQFSNRRVPLLMAQVNSSSLQIPAGLLLPGKNYYWYVESIHAPGTKSEATTSSRKMYFSTARASGTDDTATQTLTFWGTVKYINLESGFWGIVSDDGKNYDPINLAEEFRREGKRVQVKAVPKDRVNIHMWGTIIEITTITKMID